MAGVLANRLGDPDQVVCYSSPLGRARATAEIISAELGLDFSRCRFDAALKEMNTGRWDGLTFAEIDAAYSEDLAYFRKDSWRHSPPGGESYAMLAARISAWMEEREQNAPLLVISHGIAGQVFRGIYLDLDEAETVSLYQPQDVVFELSDGRVIEWPVS